MKADDVQGRKTSLDIFDKLVETGIIFFGVGFVLYFGLWFAGYEAKILELLGALPDSILGAILRAEEGLMRAMVFGVLSTWFVAVVYLLKVIASSCLLRPITR